MTSLSQQMTRRNKKQNIGATWLHKLSNDDDKTVFFWLLHHSPLFSLAMAVCVCVSQWITEFSAWTAKTSIATAKLCAKLKCGKKRQIWTDWNQWAEWIVDLWKFYSPQKLWAKWIRASSVFDELCATTESFYTFLKLYQPLMMTS